MKCFVLSVFLLLLAPPLLHAQQAPAASTVPLCKSADLDADFYFADLPAGQQTLNLTLHNRAPQACRLKGEIAPSFATDGHSAIVNTCWFCTPDGHYDAAAMRQNDLFVLPGGGSAHVSYQWASAGEACQKIDWIDFFADWDTHASFLFINPHWRPHVCGVMQISGYLLHASSDPRLAPDTRATLKVVLPPNPVYADEYAKLTITLQAPKGTIQPTGRCPELYAVYDVGGSTRFEAVAPEGYGTLVVGLSTQPSGEYISGYGDDLPAQFRGQRRLCEVQGQERTTAVTLPASLRAPINIVPQPNVGALRQLVWRAESTEMHEPVFVSTDVHFTVLDPDTLPPNWGPQTEGIGAGLSVDKSSFALGESIPLHLHWENFAASKNLAVGECEDPQPRLEIQDASHQVLGEYALNGFGCVGHGWGSFAIPQGKPRGTSASLRYSNGHYTSPSEQTKIDGAGVYFLVLVWSPPTLLADDPGAQELSRSAGRRGDTYATARSLPVRIEILPDAASSQGHSR